MQKPQKVFKTLFKTWARGIRNNFEGVKDDAGNIWTKTKTIRRNQSVWNSNKRFFTVPFLNE